MFSPFQTSACVHSTWCTMAASAIFNICRLSEKLSSSIKASVPISFSIALRTKLKSLTRSHFPVCCISCRKAVVGVPERMHRIKFI